MFSAIHDQRVIYGLADNTHTQHCSLPHELHFVVAVRLEVAAH